MDKSDPYEPPYAITSGALNQVAAIAEAVGQLSGVPGGFKDLRLRRINRIRTIQGSLAIEGNTLSEAQISAILEGKRVIAPPREILEVQNAIAAYDRLSHWKPTEENDLLAAHRVLMAGLIDEAGMYRPSGVGVMAGERIIHMAPPANRVPLLMGNLLEWLRHSNHHPLISSSVFHYEFEFIHPFSDGNGRLGRLWQNLILTGWNSLFADIPVESLVYEHQPEYYQALRESTDNADCTPFIEFMLGMILQSISSVTPQVAPQLAPQVKRLIRALNGEMTRQQLQNALGLHDRKSFTERYINPALADEIIEMTIPQKQNSRLQKYRLTAKAKRFMK